MRHDLKDIKIAILATDGVEQSELLEPRRALEEAGAEVCLVSPAQKKLLAFRHHEKGDAIEVDLALDETSPDDFDGLFLPGGVMNPDQLRMNENAVNFVRHFAENSKPIAAICHGPWLLAETEILRGKTVTSWPSIKTDLKNAGAKWVNKSVVRDHQLLTSRKPADIPDFNKEMIKLFAACHELQGSATPENLKPSVAPDARV